MNTNVPWMELDLHLFGEGGGGAAGAGAGDGAGQGAEGAQGEAAAGGAVQGARRGKANPLADVVYGRQADEQMSEGNADQQQENDCQYKRNRKKCQDHSDQTAQFILLDSFEQPFKCPHRHIKHKRDACAGNKGRKNILDNMVNSPCLLSFVEQPIHHDSGNNKRKYTFKCFLIDLRQRLRLLCFIC